MERNLRLYPRYLAARSMMFWLPVFFLYFSQELGLADVLLLEAVYYGAFLVLEVPSGYLSDRVGRRPTLMVATCCWAAGAVMMASGSGFAPWAAGQVLLAAGMSFNSGTDQSLLYDTLVALGREDAFRAVEGRANAVALLALAIACLVGGAVGAVALWLPYALAAVGLSVAFGVAWQFVEPPRAMASGVRVQGRAVVQSLRDPLLLWAFGFSVAMTVLNHVPYEFYQPYLDFLLDQVAWTPLVTGVTMASMLLLAALASAQAERVASWAGTGPTLLGAMALQIGVILAMAVTVHPAVVLAILLRSVPMGLMRPVLGAAIHPRLRSDLRATWLSVQSLVGRLSFAVALTAASIGVGETALSEASMTMVLRGFAVVGLVIFCGFALTVRATRSPAAER